MLAASYTTNTLASFVVGNNDPGKPVHTPSTSVVGNYTKNQNPDTNSNSDVYKNTYYNGHKSIYSNRGNHLDKNTNKYFSTLSKGA